MKNRVIRLLIVAFCLIGTQWACKPAQEMAVEPLNQDITIEEAQSWRTTQQVTARLGGARADIRGEEYWSLAQKQTFTNGRSLVVVPLTYGYEPVTAYLNAAPERGKPLDVAGHMIQSKLVIYKDDKGAMQANLIRIIPTDEDRAKNKRVKADSFSGYVIRYDASGKVALNGWTYRNGKLKDNFDYTTRKGGRMQGVCTYFISRKLRETAMMGGGSDVPPSSSGSVYVHFGGATYELSAISAPCPTSDGGGGSDYGGSGYGSGGGGAVGLGETFGGLYGRYEYSVAVYEDTANLESSQAYQFLY